MKNIYFRPLKANEIEVKISCVRGNGVKLMLWKNNVATKNILDETLGNMNYSIDRKSNDSCSISIFDEERNIWITKTDYGSAEKDKPEYEKRLANDALKRAGTLWGIGTELYTTPENVKMYWVGEDKCHIEKNIVIDEKGNNIDEWVEKDNYFVVTDIEYDDNKNITYIKFMNSYKENDKDGNPVKKTSFIGFGCKSIVEKEDNNLNASDVSDITPNMGNKAEKNNNNPILDIENKVLSELEIRCLKDALKREGISEEFIIKSFKIKSLNDVTYKMFSHINCKMDNIKKEYAKTI